MAKVTVVVSDADGTGLDLSIEFDPPLEPGEVSTEAQLVGMQIAEALGSRQEA